MRRLERLQALIDHLRARRTAVTVAELAEHFGVTQRTMFRDLASLRETSVPIESDAGPGGGVRLARTYSLPPLGLSIEEAVSLWLAVQLTSDPVSGPALARALDKMLGGVPAVHRAAFGAIVDRIVIGNEPWPQVKEQASALDPEIFRACEQSLLTAHGLTLRYADRQGRETTRYVEPHGLLVMDPVWYLLAFDRLRGEPRSFRLDRIRATDTAGAGSFEPRDPRALFPVIAALSLERGR